MEENSQFTQQEELLSENCCEVEQLDFAMKEKMTVLHLKQEQN